MNDKPSAIRPAGEHQLRNGINVFIYANPGAGKTPLIATGEKTLILDSDGGAASAVGSQADVWEDVNDWITMDEVYEYLRHSNHGYRWVWWDGVSIGQDKLLEGIMVDLITNQNKSHRKPYLIDKGEYGQNMQRIKQWIRHMHAQPFNFGVTGHPSPSLDESTDEMKLWPWIQGRNMPQTICSTFDVIAFGRREEGKLKLFVAETDEYYARDRFGALGSGLVNPTIPQIERLVRAKVGVGAVSKAPARPAVNHKPTTSGLRPLARRR